MIYGQNLQTFRRKNLILSFFHFKGFYFSFYKTLVSMPFSDGLIQLMKENTTEFGNTINALHRFNLYPELILSSLFSVFRRFSDYFEWETIVCWRVNRGGGMPPIESCEGLGNYHYFYIYGAFLVASSVIFSLFIGGFSLSQSFFGGILASISFMFNHGEATRAQWTPPLRESFGYPIFLLQTILTGYILRKGKINLIFGGLHVFLTVAFCCFWQLSQFIIGTQLGTLVLLFSFELISFPLLFSLWQLFLISYCLSISLLFGNLLILNSFFSSSLISILIIFIIHNKILNYLKLRPLFIFLHLFIYFFAAISIKLFLNKLFDLKDDNNVFELLKAKLFPNYANFHTLLYTCAPEFDFLQFETISKLISTWLLPLNCLVICFLFVLFYRFELANGKWLWRSDKIDRFCPEIAYHSTQLFIFIILALLFMRLKLFATPHLCLYLSLLSSNKIWTKIETNFKLIKLIFVGIILAGMANKGIKNIQNQLEMRGEYNNPEQENLFIWINENTLKDSVFAGTMALMANLKLSTLRPIVNHPHYENEEIRRRTLRVYSLYSRKSVEEVYFDLKKMGVQFYVFQPQQCLQKHPKKECSYLAMWDLQDPKNR
ncbi:unnamed protein product [Meloidogyne enterolobii]|uniref:Uncharacterized protein n=1 Tax=Meloidogyne enterolobii TaxID=390850 RepID=A0ACB1A3K4_MELEN